MTTDGGSYTFDTESDRPENHCAHGLLWSTCLDCMSPGQRSQRAWELAHEPPMPLTESVTFRITAAQKEELEGILARREESLGDYFRFLLELGLMTDRRLFRRDLF